VCVTAHDLVGARFLTTRSSIDHICFDSAIASEERVVRTWEAEQGGGVRLSDHDWVYVDLAE
jgi:hypothetical protein